MKIKLNLFIIILKIFIYKNKNLYYIEYNIYILKIKPFYNLLFYIIYKNKIKLN